MTTNESGLCRKFLSSRDRALEGDVTYNDSTAWVVPERGCNVTGPGTTKVRVPGTD